MIILSNYYLLLRVNDRDACNGLQHVKHLVKSSFKTLNMYQMLHEIKLQTNITQ